MSQPLAVIGGAMGGGGGGGGGSRTPIYQADTVRSRGVIEIVGEWCWGEIAGFPYDDPLKGVKLDGTPVKDSAGNVMIQGVTFDYRLGTQDQSYIPGTLGDAAASPEAVNVNVVHATPITRTVTGCDAVRVILTFSGLYYQNPTTGDRTGTTVNVQIDVRINGVGSWLPVNLSGRGTVSDKQDGAYQRMYVVDLRQFSASAGSFDVRVTRVTPDPDANTVNAFKWDSLVKLTYAKLRRPNIAHFRLTLDTRYFSQVPKISCHLRGWLCYVPHALVYNPETRAYTGADWDGTLVRAFTRCPAWFLYTVLLTEGQGLGDHIDPAYQDKWAIYKIAQRCDQLVNDGKGGQEFRYSIDAWISESVSAYEMINQIAGTFDAQALWSGNQVYLTQDAPKPVRNLYVPANVAKGRFAYSSSARQVRYTSVVHKYHDADDQSRLVPEPYEHIEARNRYGYLYKEQTMLGCYSRGQAARANRRLVYTGLLETDAVVFSPSMAGSGDLPGDVIRIANPRRQGRKRMGGRVLAGSTASAVVLDAPVTLATGVGYRLSVISSDGEVMDAAVSNAAGVHSVLNLASALAEAPEAEMEWIVYDPNSVAELYRILEITENDDIKDGPYTISAIQYDPAKYDFIDGIGTLEPTLPPIYQPARNGVVAPSGLQVVPGVYLALEGMRRYIDISWSRSTDSFLRGYALVVRHVGAVVFEDIVDAQSKRILNPAVGQYQITLSAINIFGKYSTSITVDYTLDELYPIEAISITDLQILGGGTTFAGRVIELDWDNDAQSVLGFSASYGTGQGGQSPWFRDYQVDIYAGATLLRSEFPTESRYQYTYEQNLEDGGPRRSITAKVRARDMHGRYSQQAEITVSNPAPAAISAVSVNAGFKSLILTYTRPPDNDWAGAIVFVGTATGFTPSAGNRVYVGSDATITIPNLLEDTPYFIRIASFDAFGGIDDYVLSGTEYTKTIASIALPDPEAIKNGLQTALDNAVDPLVFEADVFALRLDGVEKTPFIVGVHNGLPAILMDADVVVTGALSADQLIGGRIAATEDIIVGNGNARINGNGSIIVYNGADTVSNRDFAMLSGGTLTFQRYRGGAYHEYKSVRRVEYGQANSGETVTLPGYWDAQPRLMVSPASLRSYDAANVSSTQTWTVRGQNLHEVTAGSGIWAFDAIAELNYASSAGVNTVASNSGPLSVNGWTSGNSILPNNTASINVEAKFSSVRGNGISTYGYFYRTVTWTVQGWDGTVWTDMGTKSRNILASEHGQQITDTMSVNIDPGISMIRLVFVAADTNGSIYYSSGGGDNDYLYDQNTVASNGATATAVDALGTSSDNKIVNLTAASYSPPAGWDIYAIDYQVEWQAYHKYTAIVNIPATFYSNANYVYWTHAFTSSSPDYLTGWTAKNTGDLAVSSYDSHFWTANVNAGSGSAYAETRFRNPSAVVKLRKLIANDSAPANNFTFQNYAWNISGSTAIAQGSLNWIAVGD